jgi:SAM-dependent methyltransferase
VGNYKCELVPDRIQAIKEVRPKSKLGHYPVKRRLDKVILAYNKYTQFGLYVSTARTMSDQRKLEGVSSAYTDGSYAASNPDWHVGDSPWKARQILKAINRLAKRPNTVAEIGCGAGGILTELSSLMRADFFGFDPSSYAISLGRSTDTVVLRQGGAEDMENYDLVLCIDVIEHVEDVFSFLRSLLPKGKSFIFHIPLDMNCYCIMRNVVMINRQAMGHIHYFDCNTAIATLTDCGYSVKDWFYTSNTDLHRSPAKDVVKSVIFKINPRLAALTLAGFSIIVTAAPADLRGGAS